MTYNEISRKLGGDPTYCELAYDEDKNYFIEKFLKKRNLYFEDETFDYQIFVAQGIGSYDGDKPNLELGPITFVATKKFAEQWADQIFFGIDTYRYGLPDDVDIQSLCYIDTATGNIIKLIDNCST